MSVASRVERGLHLVAGGGSRAAEASCTPAAAGVQASFPHVQLSGQAILSELFPALPRDAGWTGFVLRHLSPARPLLWVQERMAILEGGAGPCRGAWGARPRPHPCRGARRQGRLVGDGGGAPMLGARRRDRRIVGRSPGARLHRQQAAGGCGGAFASRLLADPPPGRGQPQRRPRTVAAGERAERPASLRSQGTRRPALDRRAVPLAPSGAGKLGGWPGRRRQ